MTDNPARAGHTPGPWRADGAYVFAGKNCIGIFDTDNASIARMEANARIAGSALDLLDALKAVHLALLPDEISGSGKNGRLGAASLQRARTIVKTAIARAVSA
jgi:hypothetical protein